MLLSSHCKGRNNTHTHNTYTRRVGVWMGWRGGGMQKNDGKKVKDRGGESDREKESYSLRTVFIQLELTVSLHQRNILEISFLYISFFNYCFPEKSTPPPILLSVTEKFYLTELVLLISTFLPILFSSNQGSSQPKIPQPRAVIC